jgi:hypothetical protein
VNGSSPKWDISTVESGTSVTVVDRCGGNPARWRAPTDRGKLAKHVRQGLRTRTDRSTD